MDATVLYSLLIILTVSVCPFTKLVRSLAGGGKPVRLSEPIASGSMMFIKKILVVLAIVSLFALVAFPQAAVADSASKRTAFLSQAFNSEPVSKPQSLWLTKEVKQELKSLFDYEVGVLRVRYWLQGDTTAWVLDEIGKEQPITMGLAIDASGVKSIQVLEYRESRGGEIQYPFFTQQFDHAVLKQSNDKLKLDRNIDGITGATLSVRAMTKVAKVALYLHSKVTKTKPDNLAGQT